jgi:hypothetical protein
MNVNDVKKLRDTIQEMDAIHQVNILKIIKKNTVDFTENNNGIFINMSLLDDSTIAEMTKFVRYVNLQEKQLDCVEDIKAQYKKELFKGNKENLFC